MKRRTYYIERPRTIALSRVFTVALIAGLVFWSTTCHSSVLRAREGLTGYIDDVKLFWTASRQLINSVPAGIKANIRYREELASLRDTLT